MNDFVPRPANGLSPTEPDARARERLLRAAADVFDRKGYAAASVREIVEQAGITKPVLYYHFGSKEGMLSAILEEGERRIGEVVDRVLANPDGARARVKTLVEELYLLFSQNVSVVRVAHALYFGPREGAPAFDWCRFERLLGNAVGRIVQDGIASGEIRCARPEDVALAINGVIEGCSDLELRRDARSVVGVDTIHRVVDLIFDGLSAARASEGELT